MARIPHSSFLAAIVCWLACTCFATPQASASFAWDILPAKQQSLKFDSSDWMEIPSANFDLATAHRRSMVQNSKEHDLTEIGLIDCRMFDRIIAIETHPKRHQPMRRWFDQTATEASGMKLPTSTETDGNASFSFVAVALSNMKASDWLQVHSSWDSVSNNWQSQLERYRPQVTDWFENVSLSRTLAANRNVNLPKLVGKLKPFSVQSFVRVRDHWERWQPKSQPQIATKDTSIVSSTTRSLSNTMLFSFPVNTESTTPVATLKKAEIKKVEIKTSPSKLAQSANPSISKSSLDVEDEYWQYYEDCDYWKVDFEPQASTAIAMESVEGKGWTLSPIGTSGLLLEKFHAAASNFSLQAISQTMIRGLWKRVSRQLGSASDLISAYGSEATNISVR